MLKVLFVGPSLSGIEVALDGIDVRGPAAHGDVLRAVNDGAVAIGLVDGFFEAKAAVWHKEILHGLALGVQVLGASSMGALRAAECRVFGMQAIGQIAHNYCLGLLKDDADVALTHMPAEFGYAPITEAMVEVEATLSVLVARGFIDAGEERALVGHARAIFFADRTRETIFDAIPSVPAARCREIGALYAANRQNVKQRDALEMVAALRSASGHRGPKSAWPIAQPTAWLAARVRLGSL